MNFIPSEALATELKRHGLEHLSAQVELDAEELAMQARKFKSHHVHGKETDEQLLDRAAYYLIWKQHGGKQAEETSLAATPVLEQQPSLIEFLAPKLKWAAGWGIAVLLLLSLIAIRAHGQVDLIKIQDNAGNPVGTMIAVPTFKAGANCSWSKSGATFTFNCSGGAAAAGGSSGQVQWNSTGSLAGVASLTTDGTINTALAGADWLFADLTTPTKKFKFDASNISAATTRTMNVPDANATFAQAKTAAVHKFFNVMSAQGVFTDSQPACGDLSDAGPFCSGTAYSSLSGTPSTFAPSAHNLFSAQHGDTVAHTPVLGDLPFANSTPAWDSLAGNITTTKKYLSQTGNGAISAAPAWAQVNVADLSGFGTGVATFLGTPTSANLFAAITDEIGNGSKAVKMDSVSGNGTALATTTGALTSTHCVNIDANSNFVDSGSTCGGGSANPANLSVQGQTAASTTIAGSSSCSGGRRYFIYTITGATLTTNDLVDIAVKLHKATGSTDGPRFSICIGSVAGSGTECTPQINTGTADNGYLMDCHFTVTGASAEDFNGDGTRLTNGSAAAYLLNSGTYALAVASNIVIEVFGWNVSSTDTFRGDYLRVTQNVNK